MFEVAIYVVFNGLMDSPPIDCWDWVQHRHNPHKD